MQPTPTIRCQAEAQCSPPPPAGSTSLRVRYTNWHTRDLGLMMATFLHTPLDLRRPLLALHERRPPQSVASPAPQPLPLEQPQRRDLQRGVKGAQCY